MKYEMKELWNWKQVETILWKKQKDRRRNQISEERKKERSGRVKQWYDI